MLSIGNRNIMEGHILISDILYGSIHEEKRKNINDAWENGFKHGFSPQKEQIMNQENQPLQSQNMQGRLGNYQKNYLKKIRNILIDKKMNIVNI